MVHWKESSSFVSSGNFFCSEILKFLFGYSKAGSHFLPNEFNDICMINGRRVIKNFVLGARISCQTLVLQLLIASQTKAAS